MNFKQFIIEMTELEKNVQETLKKIPKSHSNLIKGFKFKWESGPTLKGDNDHIGIIDPKTKTITIAAPYAYPREFTLLHELGHAVFNKYVLGTKWEEKWKEVCKSNKHRKKDENDEENYCHAYSNYFVKNKIVTHSCPEWEKYFDEFLKQF